MGLIKQLRVQGNKSKRRMNILFDSGASECFIRASLTRSLGYPTRLPQPKSVELGRGHLRVSEVIAADVLLNGYRLHWYFVLVPQLTEEVIIGADFFQRWKIKLDPEHERLIVDPKALRLKLV